MSHRPVCVKCSREMRPERNETICLDLMDDGKPYQIWESDLYKCPGCGFEILTGFGQIQIAEHYEEGFDEMLKEFREHSQVVESRQ